MKKYDVMIIGAGASGMTAAHAALARGRSVAVIDMGDVPLRKVAVSGGGRCNFTNAAATRNRYFGGNPDFVRGPLARVATCWIGLRARAYAGQKKAQDSISVPMAQARLLTH